MSSTAAVPALDNTAYTVFALFQARQTDAVVFSSELFSWESCTNLIYFSNFAVLLMLARSPSQPCNGVRRRLGHVIRLWAAF